MKRYRNDAGYKPRWQKRAAGWLLILLMGLFVYYVPSRAMQYIGHDRYEEWVEQHGEPAVGMIEIWHIVGFKPYSGSLGAWLGKEAESFFSDYIGVYCNVRSVTQEQAQELYSRGLQPDVISFAHGTVPVTNLAPLSFTADDAAFQSGLCYGKQYALPYCASGWLLIYAQEAASSGDIADLAASSGSAEEFKAQKAPSCITDIRGAGDLDRAQLMGKCPYFEAEPFEASEPLVQYIALGAGVSPEKRPYCEGLICFVTGSDSQQRIASLGLLPIISETSCDFERDYIKELYERFDPAAIPPCF